MILPYVYKLTHKETGQFYIGYRSTNKVMPEEDIGVRYFTSSKVIKSMKFSEFNIEIQGIFFNKEYAYDFEQEMIFNNWGDPLLLNKICHHGKATFNRLGCKHSEETLNKFRNRVVSIETRIKMSMAKKGLYDGEQHHLFGIPLPKETRIKISNTLKGTRVGNENSFYGKSHSEETKTLISNKNKGKLVGKNNPYAKPVLVNGVEYSTVKEASESNNIYRSRISEMLNGKRELNDKIWQAEYIVKEKYATN